MKTYQDGREFSMAKKKIGKIDIVNKALNSSRILRKYY